jgi:outer membrane protein
MNRWTMLLALSAGVAAPLAAQDPGAAAAPTATLTLAEALQQARANSPTYRQTLNDLGPARWGVRNAYASFLPSASASAGLGYTGSGSSSFGGTFFDQSSPSYNSDYSIGLQWRLDGQVLTAPGAAKANQRAAERDVENADAQLKFAVTTQYLQGLQNTAQVEVAQQQVARNDENLKLARARYEVGQATLIDVRRAEVDKAQAEVQLLRAQQAENEAKLELLRRMGIVAPVSVEQLRLTDSFAVATPDFQLEQLMTLASEQNPELRALKAREDAASANVTAAKSEYLPSLSFRAGWQGFTQQFTDESILLGGALASAQSGFQSCQDNNVIRANAGLSTTPDCAAANGLAPGGTALREDVRSGILANNNVFPFNYTRQPFSAGITVSLPLFTGFGRQLRVSQARAQQQDAEEGVRARALQVRTEVQARWLALQTSHKAIAVQAASRDAAREQLRLAQDRYRLGSGTSLELSDAQNAVARAEGDYVNAVYDYHKALAALEAAVGRPLR